eukprot:CAMPEP_0119564900 /NCGR_PEP_ID=MMETSP1352-20130426/28349_1 /TAXON_ID=265584 /ORGANISM="Stauroneis constricta, Strain CCMP1120" /LENGTH=481 /DNA_ID=CAMNT_0007613711 /DNA_START=74 /DNA_END=1518 /DNA_ORIENTATION=+
MTNFGSSMHADEDVSSMSDNLSEILGTMSSNDQHHSSPDDVPPMNRQPVMTKQPSATLPPNSAQRRTRRQEPSFDELAMRHLYPNEKHREKTIEVIPGMDTKISSLTADDDKVSRRKKGNSLLGKLAKKSSSSKKASLERNVRVAKSSISEEQQAVQRQHFHQSGTLPSQLPGTKNVAQKQQQQQPTAILSLPPTTTSDLHFQSQGYETFLVSGSNSQSVSRNVDHAGMVDDHADGILVNSSDYEHPAPPSIPVTTSIVLICRRRRRHRRRHYNGHRHHRQDDREERWRHRFAAATVMAANRIVTPSPHTARHRPLHPPCKATAERWVQSQVPAQAQTEQAEQAEVVPARNMQQYVAYSRLSDDAQSVIQLCEHARMPVAKIKKGEVLFKTLVSTISITDTITRRGRWDEVNPDPFIISGTVFFVGEITEEKNTNIMFISFKPSDRVMALVKSGANARYVCIWKKRLINAPDSIPDPALLA